jgi:flagellin-like hook-associated protein FlgL
VKVLSAGAGKLTVQVGANDGETIDIDLQEVTAKTLGLDGFNVNGKGVSRTPRQRYGPAGCRRTGCGQRLHGHDRRTKL